MPLDEYQQATLQECMQREGCPLCWAVWNMDTARFAWYVNEGPLGLERDCQGTTSSREMTELLLSAHRLAGALVLHHSERPGMIGAKSPGHADLDAYMRICAVFPQENVRPLLIVFAHQTAEGAARLATSAIQVRVEHVTSREETAAPA